MKKILLAMGAVLGAVLLASAPLHAQKIFLIGEAGYSMTGELSGKLQEKQVDSNAINTTNFKSKTSGAFAGGIGVGADFGKFDIFGKWNHISTGISDATFTIPDLKTTLTAKFTDSEISQNNFTIGGKYRMLDGNFQPYIGANIGFGLWNGKTDNKALTISGISLDAHEFKYEGNGTSFVAGLNLGADYKMSDQVFIGASYGYDFGMGDKELKYKGPNTFGVSTDKIIFSSFGTHSILLSAKVKF